MPNTVEIRCPEAPYKLFAKVNIPDKTVTTEDWPEWEVSCSDCRRRMRNKGEEIGRVLHFYSAEGIFLGTELLD